MATSTPKTMSSRLMTMKFMQRSAAKNTNSSPSTSDGPPSKRMRMSNGGSAPGTPGTPDHEILQSALAAEEKKRQEALDKAALHTGETKWVLSFKDPLEGKRADTLNVVQTGFADIDAESDSEDEEVRPVRKQFGGGLKKPEKLVAAEYVDRSEDESDASSGEDDSDDPAAELIRETKRQIANENREKKAPKMTHPDSSLRGLSSISGGGGLSGRGSSNSNNVECYQCGQKGHVRAKCPQGAQGKGRRR